MANDHSKADRKCRRKLGAIAWERELRSEIQKIAEAIREMESDALSPHEVNERIHEFHNGVSRDLWDRYSPSDPLVSVYRAYYDGFLTDADIATATDGVRKGIREFVDYMDSTSSSDTQDKE